MRPLFFIRVAAISGGLFLASAGLAGTQPVQDPSAPPSWDAPTERLFSSLPIQDEGRIKPMGTFAAYTLMKFSGKQTCKDPSGNTLSATAWLMHCLFHPRYAQTCNVFRVDDSGVMVALGLPFTRKRDLYAHQDLAPAAAKLSALAEQYAHVPAKQRTPLQTQLLNLASNVHDFESLLGAMDFTEVSFTFPSSDPLGALFPQDRPYRISDALAKSGAIRAAVIAMRSQAGAEKDQDPQGWASVGVLLGEMEKIAAHGHVLALFPPPPDSGEKEWMAPADVVEWAFDRDEEEPSAAPIALLRSLEDLALARHDAAAFAANLRLFHDAVTQIAMARGEYEKVPLENAYHRAKLFQRSLMLYILAFLILAASWALPKRMTENTFTDALLMFAVFAPTACLGAGIVLRCIIRERPPVTTLYETILFVTFTAALIALLIEFLSKQRLALSLGAILGVLGMFLANKYEIEEGVDTMPSMVAVLDSNFWLSTHVTTIAIGYAAGLLAGAIAHVYLLGKLMGFRKDDPVFYGDITRMVYGTLCFSLLFSVIGTVLGGVWANESWGRFWGWDPKENGALLIVLWQLALLHARLGGYLRDHGVNMGAVFGGIVVAFSWFGVNLLGVGLHSYGFATGTHRALLLFYAVEGVALLLGWVAWLRSDSGSAGQSAKT